MGDIVSETLSDYAEPVFSPDESAALLRVHRHWLELIAQTPHLVFTYEHLSASQIWPGFMDSCRDAYQLFMRRGSFLKTSKEPNLKIAGVPIEDFPFARYCAPYLKEHPAAVSKNVVRKAKEGGMEMPECQMLGTC